MSEFLATAALRDAVDHLERLVGAMVDRFGYRCER